MSVANAILIALIGACLALTAVLGVVLAAMFKLIHKQRIVARASLETAVIERLVTMAMSGDEAHISVCSAHSPLILAKVLSRALELVAGDAADRLVQIAALSGCQTGLRQLARSRRTQDRIHAVRAMRFFPSCRRSLGDMARSDRAIGVRVAAIRSLADLGCPPIPKAWSRWVQLGRSKPHPSIKNLLEVPTLIQTGALIDGATTRGASAIVRAWCLEAVCGRDDVAGEALAVQVARNTQNPDDLRAVSALHIKDPLVLALNYDAMVKDAGWRVLVAVCKAASLSHATVVVPRIAQLTFHTDWRVRAAAVGALKILGGAVPKVQIVSLSPLAEQTLSLAS